MRVRYCHNVGDVLLPICWWDAHVDDVRTSLQWSALRALKWLHRWSERIGDTCCTFAPEGKPYLCSKRAGHRGMHCALVLHFDGARVRLRSAKVWSERREAAPSQDAGDGSPTTRGGDRQA